MPIAIDAVATVTQLPLTSRYLEYDLSTYSQDAIAVAMNVLQTNEKDPNQQQLPVGSQIFLMG